MACLTITFYIFTENIQVENGEKPAFFETKFAQNCVQNTLRVGLYSTYLQNGWCHSYLFRAKMLEFLEVLCMHMVGMVELDSTWQLDST